MTSFHVICGLGLPQSKFCVRQWIRDRLKKIFEDVFFFGERLRLCPWSLASASSIPVLGLERFCPRKGCPWPWPRALCPRLHLCLALAPKPQVLENCPVLDSRTTLFFEW